MSSLVTLDSVTLRAPDGQTLFEDLTLALGRERIGLVGRNGVGKSTLLRLIAGEVPPTAGAIRISARVARLRQDLNPPPGATLSDMIGVSGPLARLARIERGETAEDDLDLADWNLPQRLEETLERLRLSAEALGRPASSLSGGEITRAALAALLVAAPDLILLDEPTNNLDADGRAVVQDLLSNWRGGAVLVSHDRSLLRGMERIIEISSLGVRQFGGGWDLYAARRDEEARAAADDLGAARKEAARVRRASQEAKERKARRDAAGRWSRAKGDAPKSVLDGRAERAERTGGRQSLVADRLAEAATRDLAAAENRIETVRRLAFDLPPTGLAAGKPVLAFQAVAFAWPGAAPVLRDVDLRLIGPERVALVGPNGAGKSTWIGLAMGDLTPIAGRVTRGVRAARLDQHAAVLDDRQTLLENFQRLNPEADANSAYAALARFLFRNTAALKEAGALSGGERLRAALACVLMGPNPPQLLILDEPTNHLDLDSIEAVEAALAGYDGALVVASHDAAFLEAVGARRRIELR